MRSRLFGSAGVSLLDRKIAFYEIISIYLVIGLQLMVVFLDTETTGLSFEDRILEIGVVDDGGNTVFHSFINPEIPISRRIQGITGFSDEIVRNQPKLEDFLDKLREIFIAHGPVVIFNEKFDRRFFPNGFWDGLETRCALDAFRKAAGNSAPLETAARLAGHVWESPAHRAIADANACRTVWFWCLERINKMETLFHNRSAAEIAEMAFEAQRRMKAAEEELDACKAKLIEIANGAKLAINVPNVCRVTISDPPKVSDKTTYTIVSDAFDKLDETLKRTLLENEVVKERKRSEEPRSPTIRISPL